ncbi:MAG: HAMP domain-containing histidine kinase, partial [Cytophagales bacterium]|nr:HAMP domain-containing histidine kinase [Cytophagales bacterium]
LKRLEDSFRMQRSFVSHASHEFRTPLTTMKGHIEVNLSQKRTSAEYENILHSQLEEINKMIKLSNGLLELAQANADISSMNQKPVRVDEILYEIRDEILERSPDHSIDIRFLELPEEEQKLSVMGVDQLLKSCFKNIIDNGCKYSQDHAVVITVDFTSRYLEIIISDNGIGISWEDQQHILDPFYRANNSRSIPGHGIGLALASKIAELHKGRIFVDSELNKGTKIIVYLPFMSLPEQRQPYDNNIL